MYYILDNPDKDWDWYYISSNPNITMKDILDIPDKPWDWYWNWGEAISFNPNITMDIIGYYSRHLNWEGIAQNEFTKEKEQFIEKKYRKHIAAILIQNAYKNALVDPNCKIGINKIKRDMVDVGIVE